MFVRKLALTGGLVATLAAGRVPAADHFLMVGGGPVPADSQVSIEKNVIWIDAMMRARPFASHTLLFASGPSGRPDVVMHSPADPEVQRWLPLARLYGEQKGGMAVFRRNEVPQIDSVASEASVASTLQRTLSIMKPADSLFFVYNGHGSWQSRDTSQSALRLWGESRLDVREFGVLLDSRPEGATVRSLFPQCFSGGFARSLFRDAVNPSVQEVRPGTCGFFSVADSVEAEGCTPGVDVAEYKDYSTFFFAALAGKTRLGEPLGSAPDVNGDGAVSLAEAHVYAYTEGLSTDVPRSTSEHYLELWQPWYARWHSTPRPATNNPYFNIATRLTARLGLAGSDVSSLSSAAIAGHRALEAQVLVTDDELSSVRAEEESLRESMLADFQREWPGTANPHTAAYAQLVTLHADEMLRWITALDEYPRLAEMQMRMEKLELLRLEQRRQAAGYARVYRMLKLAAIKENFDRLASDTERTQYETLVQCESWSPPAPSAVQR